MRKRHEDLATVQVAFQVSRSALATGVVDTALRRTFQRCGECGKRVYRVGITGGEGEPVEKMYLCSGCKEVFSIGKEKVRRVWNRALYDWLTGTVVPFIFEFEEDDDRKAAATRLGEQEEFDGE